MNHLIEFAARWSDGWGSAIWRASWEGAVAIAAVWIIQRWFKTLSPRVVCWMWRAVCVKLLVALVWVQPMRIAVLPAVTQPAVTNLSSAQLTMPRPAAADRSVKKTPGSGELALENGITEPRIVEVEQGFTVASILAALWLTGVIFHVGRSMREYSLIGRLHRSSAIAGSAALARVCAEEAARIGVTRLPELRISPRVDGPLLTGIVRPAILLPDDIETNFEAVEVRLMLAHELAHVKRHDLAWNWLATVTGWVFFFHPLVWLLRRGWFEAQEAACDEILVQQRAAAASDFGRLLLKLSSRLTGRPPASLAATGVLGAYQNLEKRMVAMTRVKPFSRKGMMLSGAVFFAIALLAIAPWRLVAQERNPSEKATKEETTSSGYDLSHVVHFEMGKKQFLDGDNITIEEVRGTADTLTAGNLYEVKGTYKLSSSDKAMLGAFTTVNSNDPDNEKFKHVPIQKTQNVTVEKGDGHFKLLFYMWQNGSPHVSFYPAGGGGDLGGVYFKTAENTKPESAAPDNTNSESLPGHIYTWAWMEMKAEFGTQGEYQGFVVIDPNTGAWAKLGSLGRNLRVSPQGEMLAFGQPLYSSDAPHEIFVARLQNPEPQRLVDGGRLPVWSPNSQKVLYHVNHGSKPDESFWRFETWTIDQYSKVKKQLPIPVEDEVFDWSLQGDWLATMTDRGVKDGYGYQIHVMHPDGSDDRKISDDKGNNCYPRFSPDGKQVLFLRVWNDKSSLWAVDIDGSNRKQVILQHDDDTSSPRSACWSPDGRWLAVYMIDPTVKIENGKKMQIHGIKGNENDRIEIFAADGTPRGPIKLKNVTKIKFLEMPDWK